MSAVMELPMNPVLNHAEQLKARLSGEAVVLAHEPLAKRTTLRVGGPADLYVEPATETDLALTLAFVREQSLPMFILGRGSNLLVRDGGVRGVVLCLNRPEFTRVTVDGERLHCGAGAKLNEVANTARRHGLGGLEFLEGIPGSIGGAMRMNAGAYGGEMFQCLESLRFMDHSGHAETVPVSAVAAQYRSCPFFKTHIALGAVLRGVPTDPAEVERRMKACADKRWSSQPKAPSAGCAFKNPASIPAGRLIQELGLKGERVGTARVSLEHGNFIVTDKEAKAQDVLDLIELIRQRARAERGVELETEVQIIGSEL